MLHRPRRSSRIRPSSSLFSLLPNSCNIRTLLISLLTIWFLFVVFFVMQLSRDPPSHSPPSLVITNINKPPPILIQKKQETPPPILPNNNNNDNKNNPPQIPIQTDNIATKSIDTHTLQFMQISEKLSKQKDLPKEQQRIYSDIILPQLSHSQPREIYDMVKQQFKDAKWQPEIEKNRKKHTPKSTKKPTKSPTNKPTKKPIKSSGKYECLYYCDDVRDRECVLKHIEYWRKPHDKYDNNMDKIHELFRPEPILNQEYPFKSEGYITFKNDCGGFNNLRQAYEFIIGVTWLTQRTLVFPVTEGWYLIDWGTISIDPPPNTQGVSNYDLFYDINHLSSVISLMNLTHFLYKFQNDKKLDLPSKYHINYDKDEVTENWVWRTRQDFKKWQNHRALNLSFAVPYGINHNILLWPSYEDVKNSKKSKFNSESEYYESDGPTLDEYIGHRTKREYFDSNLALNSKEYIHFPSCVDGEMRNYRYLGQVATAIGFADFELELKYKKLIRDHSHLVPKVFEIASFMISYLGLFKYTSAHIRRNDFQFKNSWIAPQKSFKNMEKYFNKGEVIYIASDAETGFFANVTSEFSDIKAIYRWADFVEKDGKLYDKFHKLYGDLLDVETIPRKLIHLIEMVIAAGGKRFFGTTSSTYSAYITRLRGYIDAPDTEIYFHNKVGVYDFHYRPTEYMIEFKDMWLDIKDYC